MQYSYDLIIKMSLALNVDIQINWQLGMFYTPSIQWVWNTTFKLYVDRLILKDCKILW